MTKQIISHKAEQFTESVIREMTRQAQLYGAINLSQGFPTSQLPRHQARGLERDHGRHQPVRDHLGREAFSRRYRRKITRYLGLEVDPERESPSPAAPPKR